MSHGSPKEIAQTNGTPKRIRSKKPGPLAALISRWIEQNNSTYRELSDRTRELARSRDPNDDGVSWAIIGSIVRGQTQEPGPRNLWLLSRAMGITLGDLLLAIGYDPHDMETAPATVERQRTLALLRSAPDDDVKRAERVLQLDDAGRNALDALLAAVESRLRKG